MSNYRGITLSESEVQVLETLEQLNGSPAKEVSLADFRTRTSLYGDPDDTTHGKLSFCVENNQIIALAIFDSPISDLPLSLSDLSSIKSILIVNLKNLKSLPESLGRLFLLEQLCIEDCKSLEVIPSSIENLKRLKTLIISGSVRLESLPVTIGGLVSLEQLILSSCENLKTLPNSISNLGFLKMIYLDYCTSLNNLPESMSNLLSIEKFSITETPFESIPSFISKFLLLNELIISGLNISSIPEWLQNLKFLKSLDLSSTKLTALPDWIGNLTSLERLDLSRTQISTLPESMEKLEKLSSLNIKQAKLISIPSVILKLENLKSLYLQRNPLIGEDLAVHKNSIESIREYLRQKLDISIFLSYAIEPETSVLVPKIVEWLESKSGIYKVWYCERDMVGNIDGEMEENVENSQLFLFLATKKSVLNSPDCSFEIENARKNYLSIIPIKTNEVDWGDLQKVGLSRELGKALTSTEGEEFESFISDLYEYILQFKEEHDLFNSEKRKLTQLEGDLREIIRLFFEDRAFSKLVADEQTILKEFVSEFRKKRKLRYENWRNLFEIFMKITNFK
ncbi:MAG: TIR domain-containing protein [Promethearchaeota archaeon]